MTEHISKFEKNTKQQTELNNCDNNLEVNTVRHSAHGARERKIEDLKRKITSRKVQEKKGVEVTRGHFGTEYDVEPEKRKIVQENLTGRARSTESEKNRSKHKSEFCKIFKGVKFAGSKKGN